MRVSEPSFRVRPGEKLQMKVAVSMPRHLRLTALWFGISTETWGWGGGPNGQPTGMHAMLAHFGQQLFPGVHLEIAWYGSPVRFR